MCPSPVALIIKRILDVVLGSVLLLLALPVIAAMAVALRMESPGPAFFVQTRVGWRGQAFRLIKMRTLYLEGFGVHPTKELTPRDPRITPLGRILRRTKLDELPQLWHVVKGEMSLVGPRPVIEERLAHSAVDVQERARMRPGLTGVTQVSGNVVLDWDRRVALDAWYVRHWTLTLDARILALTLAAIWRDEVREVNRLRVPEPWLEQWMRSTSHR